MSYCPSASFDSIHKAGDFLFKNSFSLLSLIGSASAVACVQRGRKCTLCVYALLVQTQEQQQKKKQRQVKEKRRREYCYINERATIHPFTQSVRDNSSLSQFSLTAADIFIQIIIIYILIKNHHYVDHLHPNEIHLHGNHTRMELWQGSILPIHRQIKRWTDWGYRQRNDGKLKCSRTEQMGISSPSDSLWHLYSSQGEILFPQRPLYKQALINKLYGDELYYPVPSDNN